MDYAIFYYVSTCKIHKQTSVQLKLYSFEARGGVCLTPDILQLKLCFFPRIPTPVQTWFSNFKNEIFYDPEIFLRWKYPNLKGMTSHDVGGHFAALEKPKELADDVFLAVKSFDK